MNKQIFILIDEAVKDRAIRALNQAPTGYKVVVSKVSRSLDQNAAIHAAITEWGDSIRWNFRGNPVDLDDLKIIAMSCFNKVERKQSKFVIGLQGEPIDLMCKTSRLDKEEASRFIEMVKALTNGGTV